MKVGKIVGANKTTKQADLIGMLNPLYGDGELP